MFITLAATKVVFLVDVALVLSLLWQLEDFPLTYNGKRENWPLLLSHCRYFDKSFTEMFSVFQNADLKLL